MQALHSGVEQDISPKAHTLMGIFKALGLGLTIVILKLLLPEVMNGIEGTLTAFFSVLETVLLRSQAALSQ